MSGQFDLKDSFINGKMLKALSGMILSASGWRKVFALSGDENSNACGIAAEDICLMYNAAVSFSDYVLQTAPEIDTITLGRDTRPTGKVIQNIIYKALAGKHFKLKVLNYAAAPEIMSYSRAAGSAFIYISASHNPIGHNGLKFGLNNGGVLNKEQAEKLISIFKEKCTAENSAEKALTALDCAANQESLYADFTNDDDKQASLNAYFEFSREVIAGSSDSALKDAFFKQCRIEADNMRSCGKPFCITIDFNGSARAASIDKDLFNLCGINLEIINGDSGNIAHAILPEGKNLNYCAEKMEELYKSSNQFEFNNLRLGYMPDCDGDRGNIIYWNDAKQKAIPLEAQQVFALSVIAELSYLYYTGSPKKPLAVAVNGPTSLRIDSIAKCFNAEVFRAEVGEANVVNLAAKLRKENFEVRILGEGSNGGNITYPALVRDPLNTVFAVLKFFLLKSTDTKKGLFEIWCTLSNQTGCYKPDFTLADIIETIPAYTTTATGEERALLKIMSQDAARLKLEYQNIFYSEWERKKTELYLKYGISAYKVFCTNGTEQKTDITDFSVSGKGGLKIQFYDEKNNPVAFIWMRGSGTEPVFRIMADIKGNSCEAEKELVLWQREMVQAADKQAGKNR